MSKATTKTIIGSLVRTLGSVFFQRVQTYMNVLLCLCIGCLIWKWWILKSLYLIVTFLYLYFRHQKHNFQKYREKCLTPKRISTQSQKQLAFRIHNFHIGNPIYSQRPIHDGSTELIAKNDNTCNNNMGKIEVSILSGGSSRMAIQKKKSYNTILQKVYLIRNICMYITKILFLTDLMSMNFD